MEGPHRLSIVDGIGATEMMHIFISESVMRSALARPAERSPLTPRSSMRMETSLPKRSRLAIKGPTGCRYLDDPARPITLQTAGTSPATPSAAMRRLHWYVAAPTT